MGAFDLSDHFPCVGSQGKVTGIGEREMYDEFGKLAGIAATLIVAGIIIYQFATTVRA